MKKAPRYMLKTDKDLAAWLDMAMPASNVRRIELMRWNELARIYAAAKPASRVRRLINREARRCGYTPRTILALNS